MRCGFEALNDVESTRNQASAKVSLNFHAYFLKRVRLFGSALQSVLFF